MMQFNSEQQIIKPNPSEINAMISMLDDPDEIVFQQIEGKLKGYGHAAVPLLENAWGTHGDLFNKRIEGLLHEIQFVGLRQNMKSWRDQSPDDLMEGIWQVARYADPELDKAEIESFIADISRKIWLELNDELTGFEKVRIVNRFLYETYGFAGNTEDYHSPANSYLHQVIQNKKGNPISLSVIYLLIANTLELPIRGVNLPRHFILAYEDEYSDPQNRDVLFYINPFSQGSVFSKQEIDYFLKQIKVPNRPHYFNACNNYDIVLRVLNNLFYSYFRMGMEHKTNQIKDLLDLLTEESEVASDQ